MCGIAGIVGNVNPQKASTILYLLQTYGEDATGVAFKHKDNEKFYVYKGPLPAEEVLRDPVYEKFVQKHAEESNLTLLHCRLATHGSPLNNDNNHPIFSNNSMIIHNGIVHLPEMFKNARGKTDTEQLLLYIDKYGLEKALEKAIGSVSIAYTELESNTLWLYTNTGALNMGQTKGALYFCTSKAILSLYSRPQALQSYWLYSVNLSTRAIRKEKHICPPRYSRRHERFWDNTQTSDEYSWPSELYLSSGKRITGDFQEELL